MVNPPPFKCIICPSGCSGVIVHGKVRGDEKDRHKIMRCLDCGAVQLHPHTGFYEEDDNAAGYYEEDSQTKEVLTYSQQKLESILRNERQESDNRLQNIRRNGLDLLIASHPAGKGLRVLDIGGGYGTFGSTLLREIPYAEITILEPSKSRVETGRQHYPEAFKTLNVVHVYCDKEFSTTYAGHFDLVTCMHVMEHTPRPQELLESAFRCLSPGGLMYFETPNQDNDLVALSAGFANHHYMIHHIGYFGKREYERFLSKLTMEQGKKVGQTIICGWQRYSLLNYMYWCGKDKPQAGGTELLPRESLLSTRTVVPPVEQAWVEAREANCTSDAICCFVCAADVVPGSD